jgi:hypothetical protein
MVNRDVDAEAGAGAAQVNDQSRDDNNDQEQDITVATEIIEMEISEEVHDEIQVGPEQQVQEMIEEEYDATVVSEFGVPTPGVPIAFMG